MSKYIDKIFQSRVLSATVFFGLAGAIWGGWDLYGVGVAPADYPLTIMGAILLGVLGGLGRGVLLCGSLCAGIVSDGFPLLPPRSQGVQGES